MTGGTAPGASPAGGAGGAGGSAGSAGAAGWLALRGIEGILRDEALLVPAGGSATVGRGSGSTLPLTRSAGYRALSADATRLRQACQGVSRIHFRVSCPAPGEMEVEDLSRAGTFVDGMRVEAPVLLRDLADRAHVIRFGRGEALEARWIPARAAGRP